jgi:hypothetical protein
VWGPRCRGLELFHAPLLGTQVDLLDEAGVAMDPGGAEPVERGLSFLPLGDQAGPNARRGILLRKYVNKYLKNKSIF